MPNLHAVPSLTVGEVQTNYELLASTLLKSNSQTCEQRLHINHMRKGIQGEADYSAMKAL